MWNPVTDFQTGNWAFHGQLQAVSRQGSMPEAGDWVSCASFSPSIDFFFEKKDGMGLNYKGVQKSLYLPILEQKFWQKHLKVRVLAKYATHRFPCFAVS